MKMEHKIIIDPARGKLYKGEFSITIILNDNTPNVTKKWFANEIFAPAAERIDDLVEELTRG